MAAPELAAGHILGGRYTIVGSMGRGARVATYEAVSAPNRQVVVKLYDPALGPPTLATLRAAEAVTRDLPRGAALEVVEVGVDGGSGAAMVVTERSPRPSLADLVQLCPLSAAEAATLARNLARALGAAHERGLAHLGLKPRNVFVGPAPACEVQLADFGSTVARAAPGGAAVDPLDVPWLAPEQVFGGAAPGVASDVFSAALVVFFALTGRSFWTAGAGPLEPAAWSNEVWAPRPRHPLRARPRRRSLPPPADDRRARRGLRARVPRLADGGRPRGSASTAPPRGAHAHGHAGPRRASAAGSRSSLPARTRARGRARARARALPLRSPSRPRPGAHLRHPPALGHGSLDRSRRRQRFRRRRPHHHRREARLTTHARGGAGPSSRRLERAHRLAVRLLASHPRAIRFSTASSAARFGLRRSCRVPQFVRASDRRPAGPLGAGRDLQPLVRLGVGRRSSGVGRRYGQDDAAGSAPGGRQPRPPSLPHPAGAPARRTGHPPRGRLHALGGVEKAARAPGPPREEEGRRRTGHASPLVLRPAARELFSRGARGP